MINEPLAIPKGSVRAILAILITGATIGMAFYDKDLFVQLIPLTALVIGFYFGRRSIE